MLNFYEDYIVDSKEEQADVGHNYDEEEAEDVKLDNKRERHWRMMFKDDDGGVDDKKGILHIKRWDVYMNEKENIIKGGYYV